MRPRDQTQRIKNSSNAFSPDIASCIWARFTQKSSSQNLAKNKWKNFIGAVISLGVLGFWFGIGAALGAKIVNNLEELISR